MKMYGYAALLALAATSVAGVEVTLVKDGGSSELLTPVPSFTPGLTIGDADIASVPGFLLGDGHMYWQVDTFDAGGKFQFTCPAGGGAPAVPVTGLTPGGGCETGWAKADDGVCFIGDAGKGKGKIKRWGWRNTINGQIGDTITMPIYSAAGQCDLSKGYLSGHLHVTYVQGGLSVEFLPLPGISFNQFHLDVVKNQLTSVAPGQLTYGSHKGDSNPVQIMGDFEGQDFLVYAHVESCGSVAPEPTPAPCADGCTFYIAKYHCIPCSAGIDGGWSRLLVGGDGWESRQCGPTFTRGLSGTVHNTNLLRKTVPSGTTYTTILSDSESRYVGVFAAPCGTELPWCEPTGNPNQGPHKGCYTFCDEL